MKKTSLLAMVFCVSACAQKLPLTVFRDFTKQNADNWKRLNSDIRYQDYLNQRNKKVMEALIDDARMSRVRDYLLGEQIKFLEKELKNLLFVQMVTFAQVKRDIQVLLYALKRQGIVIDLDKENELFLKEQKKNKSRTFPRGIRGKVRDKKKKQGVPAPKPGEKLSIK